MGWFGDDSSDDEVPKKKLGLETFHVEQNASSSTKVNVGDENAAAAEAEGDVEEDPLDSYMNSLSASNANHSSTSAASVSHARSHKGRLDLSAENEEEATAHWSKIDNKSAQAAQKGNIFVKGSMDLNHDDVRNGHNKFTYESMTAKASIAMTFRKAGEGSQSKGKNYGSATATQTINTEGDDTDVRSRTIDPLEKVNHSAIAYAPFRKVFYNPKQSHFGSTWRREHDISCSNPTIDPVTSFSDYGSSPSHPNNHVMPPEILSHLHKNDFHKPTEVQAQSIPAALAGHDLIVTSQTGSGKSLSYLLPLVTHVIDQHHIIPNQDGPIALILTPTRELAKQVHLVAKKLLHVVGGKACAVTGGMGTYEMSKELKRGCELIVSTPGRFIDMVKRKSTNCQRITFIVLDEADKMLDMGFESQCGSILESIRPDRQTLMFSATFGKRVERAAKGWLQNPIRIAVGRTGSSSEHVDQYVLVLPSYEAKITWLKEVLPPFAAVGKMIIFVSSRQDCEEVTNQISGLGIAVDLIHGEKHQSSRNAALSALRKGKIQALVATDVAGRGLDVTDIMTVINFDPAKNLDAHVHRVGRAGRLSNKDSASDSVGEHKKGTAFTLLTARNADFAHTLVEAFRREGREITNDLLQLSIKSRHAGGGGKSRWDRSGLGFKDNSSDYYQSKRGRHF